MKYGKTLSNWQHFITQKDSRTDWIWFRSIAKSYWHGFFVKYFVSHICPPGFHTAPFICILYWICEMAECKISGKNWLGRSGFNTELFIPPVKNPNRTWSKVLRLLRSLFHIWATTNELFNSPFIINYIGLYNSIFEHRLLCVKVDVFSQEIEPLNHSTAKF